MDNSLNNPESIPVSGFHSIQFKAVGKILLSQGEKESLTIQADPEIRQRILTEIKDGVLIVKYISDWKDWTGLNLIDKGLAVFNITMKEIRSLAISGVGNLDSAAITTDSLNLQVAGPATMTIGTLNVNHLTVDMSGVGSVDLAGKCVEQNLVLSGAGNYKAPRLESERAAVKLSGLGNATLWANESLNVTITGAGGVEYYGPAQVNQKISGLGVLKYLGNR